MKPLRVLSLFDGISTGQYVLEKLGIPVEVYYASEIEQSTIDITMFHYPKTVQLGDVTQIDFKQFEGKIDLLIGGSPCTSLSITTSKKRTNLDGQSKLFFDYVRALNDVKPKYFFLENVASMNNESKQIMSQYMGCNPQFIDSSIFSAQERKRLYWFNWGKLHKDLVGNKTYSVPVPVEREPLVIKDILEENPDEKYYYTQTFDFHGLDKSVCATLHINGHDILKRVHSPYAKCHTLTCCRGGNLQKKVYDEKRNQCRKLTPLEYERLQGLPDDYTKYGVKQKFLDVCKIIERIDLCQNVVLKDAIEMFGVEECVPYIINDLTDMVQLNLPENWSTTQNHVWLKDAIGFKKLILECVLNIINDLKDMEVPMRSLEAEVNVESVVNLQSDSPCVVNIIRCKDYTMTLNIPIKYVNNLIQQVMQKEKQVQKLDTEKLWRNFYNATYLPKRLCIILILINSIILSKICGYAINQNMRLSIVSYVNSLNNSLKVTLSDLKMENIYTTSSTARYNAVGNGWEANTICHLFGGLKEELEHECIELI